MSDFLLEQKRQLEHTRSFEFNSFSFELMNEKALNITILKLLEHLISMIEGVGPRDVYFHLN